jgi:putative tryptophan/tyrosine transport system substrate-binding protein
MIRRREFITLLGSAAVGWPLAALAQQPARSVRIGILGSSLNNPIFAAPYASFLDELQKLGFRGDQNLSIEYRPIDQPSADLTALANEVIQSRVEVVLATGPEASLRAAVAAGPTTPIVILAVNYDPIERGYVKSLSRPGSNVTGVVLLAGKPHVRRN